MSNRTEIAHPRSGIPTRAKRAATTFASIVLAGSVVALAASKSALAATALFVGGIGEPVLTEPILSQSLGGMFTGTDPVSGTPWVRQSVSWPAQAAPFYGFTSLGDSVTQGRSNLIADIAAAQGSGNGPVTVVGASAGSLVVDETLRYYQEHPDQAPDPKSIHFVVIADGSRGDAFKAGSIFDVLSGYTYRSPSPTAYDVSVVTYQYDGLADFPDRPLNLLAVANAVAGALVLHNATYFADISNMTPTLVVTDPVTGGTTTKYFIAPQQLPLVTLIPGLAPMQDQLKQMIDAGYSRNDVVAAPAALPSTPSTQRSGVVTPPATTAPTDTPSSLRASRSIADARHQTGQVIPVAPKASEAGAVTTGAVTPEPEPVVANAPASSTVDTTPATSPVSQPQTPATDPIRKPAKTSSTTSTASVTPTKPAGTVQASNRAPRSGAPGTDGAASQGDPATGTTRRVGANGHGQDGRDADTEQADGPRSGHRK